MQQFQKVKECTEYFVAAFFNLSFELHFHFDLYKIISVNK